MALYFRYSGVISTMANMGETNLLCSTITAGEKETSSPANETNFVSLVVGYILTMVMNKIHSQLNSNGRTKSENMISPNN